MSEPKDVREMRQIIRRAAHGYDRMDDTPVGLKRISTVAYLIRAVLTMGERDGWSGEDTMTALAYHALCRLEKTLDLELDRAMLDPSPRISITAPT